MLLVVDVGNTNTVLGVYDDDKLIKSWRITTGNNRTSDETGILIHSLLDNSDVLVENVNDVIISSVVPNIMYSLVQGIRKYFNIEPMIVGSGMKTGIKIRQDNPKAVGADRIVNLVAAKELYGGPAIVIDYGTANTFDVLGRDSEFVTGFISPGIQICSDALYRKAAKLPKVEIRKPESIVTKNTVGSIQAGLVFGHIGQSIYIINEFKKELNIPDAKVIATGGLAKVIDPDGEIFDILNPVLTLEGLRILYNKNKK